MREPNALDLLPHEEKILAMLRLGSTTLPLTGWLADPRQPEQGQQARLAAVRCLVEDYGLSAVELTLDLPSIYPRVFDPSFYAAVASMQQELGFVCTAHLPFLWVDLASLSDSIHKASLNCLQRAINLVQAVEVQTYVLHPWGLTTAQIAAALHQPEQRQAIMSILLGRVGQSLDALCEVLDPATLCVENLEDDLFDLAAPILNQRDMGICLDVGHLAWQGIDALDFWNQYGARVREVHLHDVVSVSAGELTQHYDHLPLGQGTFDYVTLLNRLVKSGFEGALILEVNSKADLELSLQRLESVV
jgi:sugar phosphate isomerase/epimerase